MFQIFIIIILLSNQVKVKVMINIKPITINKDKSKIYGLRGFDLLKLRIWSKKDQVTFSIPDIAKLLMDKNVDGIVYLFKKTMIILMMVFIKNH